MEASTRLAGARCGFMAARRTLLALSAFVLAGCAGVPVSSKDATTTFSARAQSESEPPRPSTPPPVAKEEPVAEPPKTTLEPEPAADPKPRVEPIGRLDIDAILVGQSPQNQAIVGTIPSVVGFRRARLGAAGQLGEQVKWKAEFDFAGGTISFRDCHAGIDELPFIKRLRVGHIQEPFSLEAATSSNYFAFAERSPIVALDPTYNWGVCAFGYTPGERATVQAGIFRSGTTNSGNDTSGQNDMAYDLRATCLPWYDRENKGRRLFAIGGAFSERFPLNDTVAINQGPQSNLLPITENPGSPFVKSIAIPADQQQLFNVQAALVLGPLSLQAEWSATRIDQIGGQPVFLGGFYVLGSWFLTGENRDYVTKDGDFGIIHVRRPFLRLREQGSIARGPGAWELTARLAYADFSDVNIPPVNGVPVGDRLWEMTLGVNWYLNDHARVLFNYVFAEPIDPTFGASTAHAFFIRTAVFW